MKTRKFLLVTIALSISIFAAVPDDDSVPYYPYPPQPQPPQETQQPQPAPKKTPVKKAAPKKKTQVRKTPVKKTQVKKTAPVKKTSLQTGIELLKQDRYEQAKPYLLKAIQENRNDPNVWYWYGVYHEKTGGFYQAQYFYSKAVTIDPAFEPLSRVVFYPEDPEKTPLWDPKRPARVYPVETASVPLNVSKLPNAPSDPEIPKVPVYTPPEPGSSPLDGDPWAPAVYVPPAPEELRTIDGQTPVYTPPQPGAVVADESIVYRETRTPERDMIITDRDRIMRVDKPLYNPPKPGEKVAKAPEPKTQQPKQAVKTTQSSSSTKRQATVPAARVIRQSKKTPAKTPAKTQPQTPRTPVSRDVRPQSRPQPRTQPQPQVQQTPPPQPEPEPETIQPRRRTSEYLPPVGQYAPDPGTISDTPIPPVGQGNNQ